MKKIIFIILPIITIIITEILFPLGYIFIIIAGTISLCYLFAIILSYLSYKKIINGLEYVGIILSIIIISYVTYLYIDIEGSKPNNFISADKIADKYYYMALDGINTNYGTNKNFQKAIKYYKIALGYAEKNEDILSSNYQLAYCYGAINKYDLEKIYLDKIINDFPAYKDKVKTAKIKYIYSLIQQNKYDIAKNKYIKLCDDYKEIYKTDNEIQELNEYLNKK